MEPWLIGRILLEGQELVNGRPKKPYGELVLWNHHEDRARCCWNVYEMPKPTPSNMIPSPVLVRQVGYGWERNMKNVAEAVEQAKVANFQAKCPYYE